MSCFSRVLKVFLSRTAQRIPYMTGGRVMRMLAVILLVVFWFLIGWTSSVCQNLERQISLIGQGQTSDHLIFNMCLVERWDYMTAVGMWSLALCSFILCPLALKWTSLEALPSPFTNPKGISPNTVLVKQYYEKIIMTCGMQTFSESFHLFQRCVALFRKCNQEGEIQSVKATSLYRETFCFPSYQCVPIWLTEAVLLTYFFSWEEKGNVLVFFYIVLVLWYIRLGI